MLLTGMKGTGKIATKKDNGGGAARDRLGLVSAGDPCNAPGGNSLPERVAHALLPKPKTYE